MTELIFLAAASFAAAICCAAFLPEPLVRLESDCLPEGPLRVWPNAGTLGGEFGNDGTSPRVEAVDGVRAVSFSGADRMVATFTAPEQITGSRPWTCVVKAFNPEIQPEETLISWASRPNDCIQIEYGSSAHYGALGTWADPNTLGWDRGVPEAGVWHTLAVSFSGGRDGILRAYCDGEVVSEKRGMLNTKPGREVVIGACFYEGPEKERQQLPFSGSIASVAIYGRALTPYEVWLASAMHCVFPVSPERESVVPKLSTSLVWKAVGDDADSFDVYLGADANGVESATRDSAEFQVTQPADTPSFGPVALELGQTCFWRVDQRDADGTCRRGQVCSFTANSGRATRPSPRDGWIVPAGGSYRLKWQPGDFAEKQELYFGRSAEAIENSAPVELPGRATSATMPVRKLEEGETYSWRVDEINGGGLPVSRGELWGFRVVPKKLRVYLLGGQSNMVGVGAVSDLSDQDRRVRRDAIIFARGEMDSRYHGSFGWDYVQPGLGHLRETFGPELGFSDAMAAARPGDVTAIIKCAWGGTNLQYQWRPPGAGGQVGPLYTAFVKAVRDGLAALDPAFEPEICGICWMQGEADALAMDMYPAYEENLTHLISDFRREFGRGDLPLAIGMIADYPTYHPPMWGAEVRAAQADVAAKVPGLAIFDTSDLRLIDPWHYDAAGQLALGLRFAEAMLSLEA